jgi:hypothetical protein
MNNKKVGLSIFVCLYLFLFPGCNKLTNWATNNFKQAKLYAQEYARPVKEYLRSSSTYNFLTSVADFSALLLSDTVHKSYVDYYSYRHSLDLDEKKLLLERLLDENKNYVSFYLAGNQPSAVYASARAYSTGQYQKPNTMLGERDSFWRAFLRVDGVEYPAYRVKLEPLSPEYKYFFGDHYGQFKKTFTIDFDVQLDDRAHDLVLILRSSEHEVELEWKEILYGHRGSAFKQD